MYKSVPVGIFASGLATVGYSLFNADGTANGLRVTAGVAERPAGSGRYVASVNFAAGFAGDLRWDDAGSPTRYFIDTVDLTEFSMLQSMIGAANVTFTSPVNENASAIIVQGDDYLGSRSLSWVISNYVGPDLTGAALSGGLMLASDYNSNPNAGSLAIGGAVALTVQTDGSKTLILTVPLSASVTATLEPSPLEDQYNWIMQIVATDTQGHRQTLLIVAVTVTRRII